VDRTDRMVVALKLVRASADTDRETQEICGRAASRYIEANRDALPGPLVSRLV
jgi:hypothetical protein